jgi:hypothetical protein
LRTSVSATEAGFLCLRALDTYVYHHRNATFFEVLKGEKWNELHEKNKLIYYNRWGRPLKVSIVLDGKSCREKEFLNRIEDTVFYLARKQHHIDLWSPRRFTGMFQHTNVRIRTYPAMLLQHAAFFDFFMNTKKKPEKRPNAIFSCSLKLGRLLSGDKIFAEGRDFDGFIKETVDRLKEKTKEKV